MAFQIDQSGKIEQTDKDTVLCLSNKEFWDAVKVSARTKRRLQTIFRVNKEPRNYVLFVFCSCLSVLLQRDLRLGSVVVDKEYFGKETVVREIVLKMLSGFKLHPSLSFGNIGRRAGAHNRAYLVYSGKMRARKVLSLEEVLEELKKTEVGKRLKNA